MVNYYNVAKGVEPKRKKVAEAEKNLRLAQRDLANTKEQLVALNNQLADLRTQFANKTTEQQVRTATLKPQHRPTSLHLLRCLQHCIIWHICG
jgi:chromosome segregation ATPase